MQGMMEVHSIAQKYNNQIQPIIWTINDEGKNCHQEVVVLNKAGEPELLNNGVSARFYRWMVGSPPPCQSLIKAHNDLYEKYASARRRLGEREVTERRFDETREVSVYTAHSLLISILDETQPYINSMAEEFFKQGNGLPTAVDRYDAIKKCLEESVALDDITRPKVLDRIISLADDAVVEAHKELKQTSMQNKQNRENQTESDESSNTILVLEQVRLYLSALKYTY